MASNLFTRDESKLMKRPVHNEYPLVYRPDHQLADKLGFVPKRLVYSDRMDAMNIIGDSLGADLEHTAFSDGRRTDSKSVYRKWTKQSGCIEKGNDRVFSAPDTSRVSKDEIRQATQMVAQGYKPRYRTLEE